MIDNPTAPNQNPKILPLWEHPPKIWALYLNNFPGGIRTVSLPASACSQVTSLKHEELILDDTMIVIWSNFGF